VKRDQSIVNEGSMFKVQSAVRLGSSEVSRTILIEQTKQTR